MAKHPFIKGLAAGAVLGAIAAMFMHTDDKKKSTRELQRMAMEIRDRVIDHAKHVGEVTKDAYEHIVDTSMAEYRGAKLLSAQELDELRDELMVNWKKMKKIL